MPSAVQYGQLVGSSTIQPAGQSQLCYQYDATAQPALATSPVQSDPLMAAQSSQIIGSQVVQQRLVTVNQSINERFLKWPKWYATAWTTTGNKTVGTEMC